MLAIADPMFRTMSHVYTCVCIYIFLNPLLLLLSFNALTLFKWALGRRAYNITSNSICLEGKFQFDLHTISFGGISIDVAIAILRLWTMD